MSYQKIYNNAPLFVQQTLISIFNYLAYKKRYGAKYEEKRKEYLANRGVSLPELKKIQQQKFDTFIALTFANSPYYKKEYADRFKGIKLPQLTTMPILEKNTLKERVTEFYSTSVAEGVLSKTGGTTGKSLEVIFTKDDMNDRFAMLDDFRARFGYKLGKKTAWLSGKSILTPKDVKNNRFWKTDNLYKVRYYSTFHIKDDFLGHYLDNLMQYKPEYISGFPTAVMAIASYGLQHGIDYPSSIKAIFTTSETLTPTMRAAIQEFFKAPVYNQYSASEGAPFIFECKNHKLHMELQSGIFEVLDGNDQPTQEGRLVVTSFTSNGTPLVRYDIGDAIKLSSETCTCGNNNPLVEEILGRTDDFIYSPENGKIHLTNVANSIKDVKGIGKMQIIQNHVNEILFLVVDDGGFDAASRKKMESNWRERVGDKMKIEIKIVPEIKSEKSGKFRIIKNTIYHLVP
ncbi:phenylacetate--CoA ligase family protein [Ulvibacter antarcticus]|uniref:Phenylacetate-CoA ligase n=1 Tax=Ulvibacter antarcticus TaxID=442714 RepID=A0A3L9YEZ6_9FLAO|nr:phenylacetate--CoA ligase family protein [Ulvibacter antarcticus]RMA58954.1 phenylacetate-CoA ligase [Ulvibacter antarcticus]